MVLESLPKGIFCAEFQDMAPALQSNGRDGGQKAGTIFGIIIFGAITSITCFAMAQLFAMAINGSRNLHYIMHSNLVAMRVMVRQFSKKD